MAWKEGPMRAVAELRRMAEGGQPEQPTAIKAEEAQPGRSPRFHGGKKTAWEAYGTLRDPNTSPLDRVTAARKLNRSHIPEKTRREMNALLGPDVVTEETTQPFHTEAVPQIAEDVKAQIAKAERKARLGVRRLRYFVGKQEALNQQAAAATEFPEAENFVAWLRNLPREAREQFDQLLKRTPMPVRAAALALVVAGCTGGNPTPTPEATPSATITATESPTTVLPSKTPEVTPTLSPEQKLKQDMADFLSGKTVIKDSDKFYLNNESKTTLPLCIFGTTNLDYGQPVAEALFQGYLIGTTRVKSTDGIEYLEAIIGQESAPSSDGTRKRYILKLNLGSFDTADKASITTGGIVVSNPSPSPKETDYSVADMESEITKYYGHVIIFALDVVNGTSTPMRDSNEVEKQNPVAKAVIEFSKLTAKESLDKVSIPSLAKDAIIKDAANASFNEQNFVLSNIPLTIGIYVYATS
jgi:hypothetical protein